MIDKLLAALGERTIARKVGLKHEDARIAFSLPSARVKSYDEFMNLIGQYYNHHFSACFANGGTLSKEDARLRAREAIENHYRRRHNGDIAMAFNDAYDGTNGGLRGVIDVLAEQMREEAVARYVQGAFDTYVTPVSWSEKVDIIRQFLAAAAHVLGDAVDASCPERYARDYQPLIQAYAQGVDPVKRNARRF